MYIIIHVCIEYLYFIHNYTYLSLSLSSSFVNIKILCIYLKGDDCCIDFPCLDCLHKLPADHLHLSCPQTIWSLVKEISQSRPLVYSDIGEISLKYYSTATQKNYAVFNVASSTLQVQNGIATYTTWTTIATLINFTVVLRYNAGMTQSDAATVSLSILLGEAISW